MSEGGAEGSVGPLRLASLPWGCGRGFEKNTELSLLPEAVVGRQLDRSGRKVFDRCARLPCKFRAEEHGAGFGRRLQSESGRQFEEIRQPGSEPSEIGERLREQSDIVSAPSDSNADDLALTPDGEQVDGGGFGQKTLGDHPNRWIEASESVSDRTA